MAIAALARSSIGLLKIAIGKRAGAFQVAIEGRQKLTKAPIGSLILSTTSQLQSQTLLETAQPLPIQRRHRLLQ
jgi:hypothetical protein